MGRTIHGSLRVLVIHPLLHQERPVTRLAVLFQGADNVRLYNAAVKQLVLDFIPLASPAFENFIPGQNREAMSAVQRGSLGTIREKIIYLWGGTGSGKTHLIESAKRMQVAVFEKSLEPIPPRILVDNVETLADSDQIALFNAINQLATVEGSLVLTAGATAPRDLPLRPELSSRLGSGLVFQMHTLHDEEKVAALQAHARARGFALRQDVAQYLLRYGRRDMASLMHVLDELDKFSLETGREITLPLLRDLAPPTAL